MYGRFVETKQRIVIYCTYRSFSIGIIPAILAKTVICMEDLLKQSNLSQTSVCSFWNTYSFFKTSQRTALFWILILFFKLSVHAVIFKILVLFYHSGSIFKHTFLGKLPYARYFSQMLTYLFFKSSVRTVLLNISAHSDLFRIFSKKLYYFHRYPAHLPLIQCKSLN